VAPLDPKTFPSHFGAIGSTCSLKVHIRKEDGVAEFLYRDWVPANEHVKTLFPTALPVSDVPIAVALGGSQAVQCSKFIVSRHRQCKNRTCDLSGKCWVHRVVSE
jgi:hypothetical protein